MTDELPSVCPVCTGMLTFGHIWGNEIHGYSTNLICMDCHWKSKSFDRTESRIVGDKIARRGIQECLLKMHEKDPERYT